VGAVFAGAHKGVTLFGQQKRVVRLCAIGGQRGVFFWVNRRIVFIFNGEEWYFAVNLK
jgi:hypothetical protein